MDCTLYLSHSRIWNVTIADEMLKNSSLCSVLKVLKQDWTQVYKVSSEGPPSIVAFYDKAGLLRTSVKAPDVYICKND